MKVRFANSKDNVILRTLFFVMLPGNHRLSIGPCLKKGSWKRNRLANRKIIITSLNAVVLTKNNRYVSFRDYQQTFLFEFCLFYFQRCLSD